MAIDEPKARPTPEEERAEAWEYWHQRANRFEDALHAITLCHAEDAQTIARNALEVGMKLR